MILGPWGTVDLEVKRRVLQVGHLRSELEYDVYALAVQFHHVKE
jgi:hypothetical protein